MTSPPSGIKPATIHDVARLAHVSASTVSLYFSDSNRVGPEASARVREAVRELSYRPNLHAQALRTVVGAEEVYIVGRLADTRINVVGVFRSRQQALEIAAAESAEVLWEGSVS